MFKAFGERIFKSFNLGSARVQDASDEHAEGAASPSPFFSGSLDRSRSFGAGAVPAAASDAASSTTHTQTKFIHVIPEEQTMRSTTVTSGATFEIELKRDRLHEEFSIGVTLGQGSFSTVRLARRKSDGRLVAIKSMQAFMFQNQEDKDGLEAEVNILSRLRHPNIIRLFDLHETEEAVHLVMELCSGGELYTRIVEHEHYTEGEAFKALAALGSALEYCHARNIVHRDIKPENMIYTSPLPTATLKLVDFGFAAILDKGGDDSLTACGTPGYIAPEILRGDDYGVQVDVWSFGVVAFVVLSGTPPFSAESSNHLFFKIMAGDYDFSHPVWEHVSPSAKDLVQRCLVLEPAKRLTISQVMQHAWMQQNFETHHRPIKHVNGNLKVYNAARKLRGAIELVRAIERINRLMAGSRGGTGEAQETAAS